jgi:hypothetical protein
LKDLDLLKYRYSFFWLIFLILIFNLSFLYRLADDSGQNDAGTGGDAPNTYYMTNLTNSQLGVDYTSELGTILMNHQNEEYDYSDTYKFSITHPGVIIVNYKIYQSINRSNDRQVSFALETNYSLIFRSLLKNPETQGSFDVPIFYPGDYYLLIKHSGEYYIRYGFNVTYLDVDISDYLQNDGNSGGDASVDFPLPINLNTDYIGSLGPGFVEDSGFIDYFDRYLIYANSSGYLNISTNFSHDIDGQFTITVFEGNNSSIRLTSQFNSLYYDNINDKYPLDFHEMMVPLPKEGYYSIDYHTEFSKYQYNFTTSFRFALIPEQNDFNSNSDPICLPYNSVQKIPLNSSGEGTIGPGYITNEYSNLARNIQGEYTKDNMDCYGIYLPANGLLEIEFKNDLEPEFDSNPLKSDSMHLDIFGCCWGVIKSYSDNSFYSPSREINQKVQIGLEQGNYQINLFAYKKFSYNLSIAFFINSTSSTRISSIKWLNYSSLVIILAISISIRRKIKS